MCHKPEYELPPNVKDYIKWGEEPPLVRMKKGERPKTPKNSIASVTRAKNKEFYGWYDLGAVRPTQVFATYRAQYHHRFYLTNFPLAIDKDFIALLPKTKFTNNQLKTLLAFLNSTFSHFFIEIYGRSTGGGMIELDIKSAEKLPILCTDKLTSDQIKELAELFDKLENKAREIGGADTYESIEKLNQYIEEIDRTVGQILGIKNDVISAMKVLATSLMERRLGRTEMARPESVRGEEETRIKPPRRIKRGKLEKLSLPLEKWM